MTGSDLRLTRRGVLRGTVGLVTAAVVAAAGTAGCTGSARSARVEPAADDEALGAAMASEQQLLSAYAETAPQHAAHLAHLRALESRLAGRPTSAATPTPPAARPDERATVPALQAAATSARVGANAALLASIAAAHGVIGARP